MAALLAAWRETRRPVYHIQHMSQRKGSPLEPGKPGNQIKEVVGPLENEPVIQKRVNSAFIGTDLESRLRAGGIEQLVIAGLTTEHCVSTTVRMAANLGFVTTVASDATAAFDTIGPDGKSYTAEQVHEISLATLHGEFATVRRSSEILDAISPARVAREEGGLSAAGERGVL
jgi:nicotinamidase-related amidase